MTRNGMRRVIALVSLLLALAFAGASPLWSAQAANADTVTIDLSTVTTLDSNSIVISDNGAESDITADLSFAPGTMVSLSDPPAVTPTPAPSAPVVSTDPSRAPPNQTAPAVRGELSFTTAYGCDPSADYYGGKLKTEAKAYVEYLLNHEWSVRISCIKEGHSQNVQGSTTVSLHTTGEAFDVDQINGQPVAPGNSESNRFYRWLKATPNTSLPWEVGGPHVPSGRTKILRNQGQSGGPFFTNSEHNGHWHFGFKAGTGTFPVPIVTGGASSAPVPTPSTPKLPDYILPPPNAKEETIAPATIDVQTDQPDPNLDPTPTIDQVPQLTPVELPPVVDTPSVVPPLVTPAPDPSPPVLVPSLPSLAPAPTPIPPAPPANNDQRKVISINPADLQASYDRLQADGVLTIVQKIASDNGIPFAVALGLISRETNGQNELGDSGHGHCYLQIDDRSHGDWLSSHDWRNPIQCFGFGLGILNANYHQWDGNMFRALAGYKSGNGNVHRALHNGLSAEAYSAHADYASDVLARAGGYYKLLDSLSAAITPSAQSAPAAPTAPPPSAPAVDSSATSVALPPSEVVQ